MQSSGFQTRAISENASLQGRKDRNRRRRGKRMLPSVFGGKMNVSGLGGRLGRHRPKTRKEWKKFFLRAGLLFLLLLIFYFLFLWLTLPDIRDPRSLIASQSTVITDRSGIELYRLFSEQDRTYVPGNEIPDHMKKAIIAIEDERFYERGCLDVQAIGRVVLFMGRAGGGSTITRQLARNALNLLSENRYQRKIKEVILGCQLERRFTKDELVELYLNWIPFGQNAYGIEQASQVYFGTSARDLTIAQSAVLAALPQRPSYFSPYGRHVHTRVDDEVVERIRGGAITRSSQISDEKVSIGLLGAMIGTGSTTLYVGGRTDQVLMNLQEQGFITEQERLQALEELEAMVFQPSREDIRAPHFVLWVREQVEQLFGDTAEKGLLEQGGLTIETTLDWPLQQAAEEVVAFHWEDTSQRFGAENAALIAVDPHTREVLAYVGNVDYKDEEHGGKIDMVLAPRQPGSSFKPFVYAAAFQQGYGPATVIYDVPTKIGDDEPQNFDGTFMGLLTMRRALGASRNIPAAKTFFLAGGEERILRLVTELGAPSPLKRKIELAAEREGGYDYGWPLALGAAETPLFEMAQAYTTFAADGEYAPLVRIRRIMDKKGNILFETDQSLETETVLDPRIAYQITSVLSDEWARPEEYWRTQLTVPGYQTAAKTGTSNKCLERQGDGSCRLLKPDNAWTLGYTPNLVAGVWVGNANSASMYDKAGGLNTASPIWRDFMMRAHRLIDSKETQFRIPEGIVQPQVSLLSGQLPTECTPVEFRRADVFLEENAPSEPDPACKVLLVDKLTHLLASDSCPQEAQEEGSFFVARSILPERWVSWEQGVQDWVTKQMELWYATDTHTGAIIPLPVAPTEACDPALTPGRLVKPTVTIVSPQIGGVASYPAFRPRISYTAGSVVREVRYYVDGKSVATTTQEPFDQALRVPRSVQKTGLHTFQVILTDEYYNEVTDTVSFRFDEDKSLPTVRFIQPSKDLTIKSGDEIEMHVDARDPDGGIKYVQFYLGDTLLSTKPKEPFELTYTPDVPDGVYTLRAVAEDFAENKAEDSVRIIVGAGAPSFEESSGKPTMLTPSSSLDGIGKDEVIDVVIDTPLLGGDLYSTLSVVVKNEELGNEEVLLRLSSGEGTYTRQWKANRPGRYVIRLLTENRNREETEWAVRNIETY